MLFLQCFISVFIYGDLLNLEHTSDAAAERADSERIKRIHNRVRKVKENEEVGVKYMQAWEEKYYEREEGRQEGLLEGGENKVKELVKRKLQKGKSVEEIADALEEDVAVIQRLIDTMG